MMNSTTTMMDTRTEYTDDHLTLRAECLKIFLNKYGGVDLINAGYSNKDIYECADIWISQGNKTTFGIVAFFNAYFNRNEGQESSKINFKES